MISRLKHKSDKCKLSDLFLERATGVEPVPPAWKAEALPLRYARALVILPFAASMVKEKKGPGEESPGPLIAFLRLVDVQVTCFISEIAGPGEDRVIRASSIHIDPKVVISHE